MSVGVDVVSVGVEGVVSVGIDGVVSVRVNGAVDGGGVVVVVVVPHFQLSQEATYPDSSQYVP